MSCMDKARVPKNTTNNKLPPPVFIKLFKTEEKYSCFLLKSFFNVGTSFSCFQEPLYLVKASRPLLPEPLGLV